MHSAESRMSIAMDISDAITSAMNAAEGRQNRIVDHTDYRLHLTKTERMNEFDDCRELLHRVIRTLGLEKEFYELGHSLVDK